MILRKKQQRDEHQEAVGLLRKDVDGLRELHDFADEAHGCEDYIWIKALELIAAGAPNPAQIAALALETRSVKFERGYGPNLASQSEQP